MLLLLVHLSHCIVQVFRVNSLINELRVLATDDRGRAYSFPKSLSMKCRLLNQRPSSRLNAFATVLQQL